MEESTVPEKKSKKAPSKKSLLIGIIVVFVILLGLLAITTRQSNEKDVTFVEVAPAVVTISSDGFSPATIQVQAGQAVTWNNTDTASHQIASDPHPSHDGLAELSEDAPTLAGESYSFTFEQPGTYTYHDELNPDIKGTIIVE